MRFTGRRRGGLTAPRLLVALTVAVAMLGLGTGPAQADPNPVEDHYSDSGNAPHSSVVWDEDGDHQNDVCSLDVKPPNPGYTVVYPAEPNGDPVAGDHPVIAWANGTNIAPDLAPNTTCFYQEGLKHLASWGYVVIAMNEGQTGSGDEVLSALGMALFWDEDPANPFVGKLDTDRIAAAGHSQGAVGAINAALDAGPGLIGSVLALSMPDKDWINVWNGVLCEEFFDEDCEPMEIPNDATDQLDMPIFFARGSGVHNPGCRIDDWFTDDTDSEWQPTNPSVAYVFGTVRVDEPEDDPDTPDDEHELFCQPAGFFWPYPHLFLQNAYGYSVAWLEYTLGCNDSSEDAFTGPTEISQNSHWDWLPFYFTQHDPILNNLPTCP